MSLRFEKFKITFANFIRSKLQHKKLPFFVRSYLSV
jgi:hypothetical protein